MESWKKTYWAVWFSNAITAVGMMSFIPFFPSHLRSMGLEDPAEIATWAGVIFGAAPLVAAVMSPVWGALGDRVGRKVMVVRAMLAITVFVGLMSLAVEPWQLLCLRVGQGFFSGFVAPSQTLVSVAAPADRQGQVSGTLQMALAAGAIVGPLLGGVVSGGGGLDGLFLMVSTLSASAAVVVGVFARDDVSLRRDGGGGERVTVRDVLRGMGRDMAGVWANANMRAGLLLLFWIQFGMGASNPVMELFVGELMPEASSEKLSFVTGVAFTVMAVMNLFAMPVWGRYGDRRGHSRALLLCAVGCALALGLHAASAVIGVLLLSRVALGLAMAGSGPLAFGLAAAEISVDRRGSAFGVVFSARALAVSVGAMIGGWLSAQLGIRGVFLMGAGLVALSVVYASCVASARARTV